MQEGLDTFELYGAPKRPNCMAWSTNGDLAIGIGSTVHVLVPNQIHQKDGQRSEHEPTWLHIQLEVEFPTDGWEGEELAPQNDFFIGREQATIDIIQLTWAPPILVGGWCPLAVLTSNGLASVWEPLQDASTSANWTCVISTQTILNHIDGAFDENTPVPRENNALASQRQERSNPETKRLQRRIQRIAWKWLHKIPNRLELVLNTQNNDEIIYLSLRSQREPNDYTYHGLQVEHCRSGGTTEYRQERQEHSNILRKDSYNVEPLSHYARSITTLEDLDQIANEVLRFPEKSRGKEQALKAVTSFLGARIKRLARDFCDENDIEQHSEKLDIRIWAHDKFDNFRAVFLTIAGQRSPQYVMTRDIKSHIIFVPSNPAASGIEHPKAQRLLFPWENECKTNLRGSFENVAWAFESESNSDATFPPLAKVKLNCVFVAANLFASILRMCTYSPGDAGNDNSAWSRQLVGSLIEYLPQHGTAVSDLFNTLRKQQAAPPDEKKTATQEMLHCINSYINIRDKHELDDPTAPRYTERCPVGDCALPVYWRGLSWAGCEDGHVTERCLLTWMAILNPFHKKHCEKCTRSFLNEGKLLQYYEEVAYRGAVSNENKSSQKQDQHEDILAQRLLKFANCPYCGGRFQQLLADD